jgi:hypothetical protein
MKTQIRQPLAVEANATGFKGKTFPYNKRKDE